MTTTTTNTNTQESAVGADIANLYNTIHTFQTEINSLVEKQMAEIQALRNQHELVRNELLAKRDKAKTEFAHYLQLAGVSDILRTVPAGKAKGKGKQANLFGTDGTTTAEKKERKPRLSSFVVAATLERNKATYVSEYELGVDEKSGLPKRFKGRSQKNVDIDRMMEQDEAAYEASQILKADTATAAADTAATAPVKKSSTSKK